MPGPTSTMEIGGDGVAVIRLSNSPVNALHPDGELHLSDARKPRRSALPFQACFSRFPAICSLCGPYVSASHFSPTPQPVPGATSSH